MTSDLEERVLGVRCVRWNPERTDAEGHTARVSNFGDLLGPLLVERVIETQQVRFTPSGSRSLLSVGSVMHFASPGDVVWGTGINGKIGTQPLPPSLDVRAVRGPLTRAVLTARGIQTPQVFGDPALLLPLLWPELELTTRPKRRDLIIVPNLNETARFPVELVRSPIGDPWAIIDDLTASKFVTGTSLHALVVADALGIPSRPIVPENENPFKYVDYYAGTGRSRIRFARTVEEAIELGPVPLPTFEPERLLAAFPFDLWARTRTVRPAPMTYLELREDSATQRQRLGETLGVAEPTSERDSSLAEAREALGRLEMLSHRDPPLEGLTNEERQAIGADLQTNEGGPLLSVVIPTHDVLPWIGETIDSVLNQDLDLEVLVVDDHSTDGTRALVDARAALDPRLRVIDAVTHGGGTARNIGADHARGRYLVFCDGDDLVAPNAYRSLVASLESSGSDIAFGDYLKFSPLRTWSPTQNWRAYRGTQKGIRLQDEPSLLNGRSCWNKVFRRTFWTEAKLRFPDVARSNDIVPMVRSYIAAGTVDILDEVVYLYRERPGLGSLTSRAESADSLVSYLNQEVACARLIAAASSAPLDRVYRSLIFDRDGWVHLERYLRSQLREQSRDAEICALVGELVTALGADRPYSRDWRKAAVFSLLLEGKLDLAAAVVHVCEGDAQPNARLFMSWRSVVDGGLLDSEHSTDTHLPPRLLQALVRGVHDEHAADVPLLEVVRAIARRHPDLLAAIPEFADAAVRSDDELTAHLSETRRRAGRLSALESGSSIALSIIGEIGNDDRAALYDESTGRVVATAVLPLVDRPGRGRREFRGSIAVGHLPMAVRLRPVLVNTASGQAMSLRGGAQTPEYSPFDRFLLHFDDRGVLAERRPGWLPRAARRAVRTLHRGVRQRSPIE